jgi:glycosyltransferase involved in cell wall biosynthesis
MKIALIYPSFFPTTGGIETYTKHLAEQMTMLGHKVAIFTSEPLYHEISPNRYEINGKEYEVYYLHTRKFFGYKIPTKEAIKSITKFAPDIIHINSPHPYCTITALALCKTHPIIATYHGHATPKSFVKKIGVLADRLLYRTFCENIIVTSEYYKKRVTAFCPQNKIKVIPPGVDQTYLKKDPSRQTARARFNIPKNEKVILFVGGMDKAHYYKGIPTLLKCARRTPDYNYILVGEGSEKHKFIKMAEKLKLKNVTFAKNVSLTDLHAYYRAADVLTLPSTSNAEGFGLVLLEAMACGTPVITTDKVGSASLLQKNKTAIIVKSNNAKSLKTGIISVLTNKKLRENLIKNGTNLAKTMNWSKTTAATIKLYEHVRKKN